MAQVKAIPDGYRTVTPYLNVDGASAAIDFYKKAFGAEELTRMPGPDGKLMHAAIKIGDSVVMLSDAMMNPPTKSAIHLFVPDADAVWARATAAGAKVAMPLADTFWGDRYGVLTDQWENRWAVATHKEDLTREQMAKRAEEAMRNMPKP